jgi:hypothetical protein
MVMKKYRSEFESNRVLTELKFILENFQDIHIEFFKVRTKGGGGWSLDIPPPPLHCGRKTVFRKKMYGKNNAPATKTLFFYPRC